MKVWLWRATVLLATLAVWEASARMLNPLLYVGPSRLPAALGRVLATRDLPPLADHVWLTLGEIAAAYALAVAGGLWVGFVLGLRKTLGRIYEPLLAALFAVPSVVWYPSLMLFFGLGPASKIALGATISFFPIILNTIAGFGYVDRIFVLSAKSMGASDVQLFRFVLLPAAFPVILTGLRIGFTVALLSILGSETIASLAGLGHRIVHLAEGMDTARMFAYIAFAVTIALILNTVTSTLEARARRR